MSATRPSLLRRLFGERPPARQDDFADMGTAIGLDFSLDQPPEPVELAGRDITRPTTGAGPGSARRWRPRWHPR